MSSQHKNSYEIDNRENPVLDDNKPFYSILLN